ncbi:hypothetical protein EJB05_47085, partial [Eragrostis curvula]
MAVRPLDLWNHWATQILVLLSLGLQVVLLLLAGIRRREAPMVPKFILWLAYQLADSTAIYTIGHLSLSAAADRHQLVAFWAPFLLLHLGGPDNITAYALQDNELWLRHLQTLVVQVLGAAYVLYKHVASDSFFVLLAAIFMFVVGVIKYAERTWALKCGNLDRIRSSLKDPLAKHHQFHTLDLGFHAEPGDEFYARRAHSLFHVCKHAIVDTWIEKDPENLSVEMLKDLKKEDYKALWTLMEMELSLMYDLLYTKAGVIHTWPGYCIRVISPFFIAASLMLFQFSGKNVHSRVDVFITYTLLIGALILETGSLLRALGSTWTYAFLCATQWSWLRYAALCTGRWNRLRRFVKRITGRGGRNISERRWSGKMGQYNLFAYCSRHDREGIPLVGRFAMLLGYREWWIRYHYSWTIDIPDYLKKKLLKYVRGLSLKNGLRERSLNAQGVIRNNWGQEALQREDEGQALPGDDDGLYKQFKRGNLLGVEFQEGIIIWHIATEVFLAESSGTDAKGAADLVNAIKMLSNYMFFLLVDRSFMLPGLAQSTLYRRTRGNLAKMWDEYDHSHPEENMYTSLKELFCLHDDTNFTGWNSRGELANILYEKQPGYSDDVPRLSRANKVTKKLLDREKQKGSISVLKLLLNVWMDFLVYGANRCSRESHAKKLSNGSELTTILWLMTNYLHQGDYALKPDEASSMDLESFQLGCMNPSLAVAPGGSSREDSLISVVVARAMAVKALDLWNRWGIQILLLLSLSLQVLLQPLAGVRRCRASSLPRGLLWLAYQLANATAIYALGHLSLSTPARERQLPAFWAPFLLLHQGGPDSIGAYALQDNNHWLRHLLLLIVQVVAATHVLYKHLPRGDQFLQLAAFLMWTVGIVKYGEKVVTLKRGNLDSIQSSLKKERVAQHHHLNHPDQGLAEKHADDDEAHLRHAHHLFHIGKRATVDSWLDKDPEHNTLEMLKALRKKDYKGMWAFAEMVMSLMYDILYTKTGVVHTWPGYFIRLITSSLAVPASFLLFHFSGKAGHSKVDVDITYTLLAGAFLLEITSLLSALGSTWAYAFLSSTRWSWLRYATLCTGRWDQLRRLVKAIKGSGGGDITGRKWLGKMGQYNMLHYSSRQNTAYGPILGRLVTMLGFEEFWNRKHYSTTVDISDDLKQRLFEYIQRITKTGLNTHGVIRKSWGQEALEGEDKDLYERIKKDRKLGVDFQEGIILWHIGTDIFLAKRNRDADDTAELVKAIRTLSNYMMFLLVDRQNMLPGLPQTTMYRRTCENLSDMCNNQGHPRSNISSMLKEIFRLRDGPMLTEKRHIDKLADIVYKEKPQYSPSVPRLCYANGVAEELLHTEKQKGSSSVLKLLLNVWMDFLVYAANRCSRESHAKKLGRGGELTTLVWIMFHYLNQEAYAGQKD